MEQRWAMLKLALYMRRQMKKNTFRSSAGLLTSNRNTSYVVGLTHNIIYQDHATTRSTMGPFREMLVILEKTAGLLVGNLQHPT